MTMECSRLQGVVIWELQDDGVSAQLRTHCWRPLDQKLFIFDLSSPDPTQTASTASAHFCETRTFHSAMQEPWKTKINETHRYTPLKGRQSQLHLHVLSARVRLRWHNLSRRIHYRIQPHLVLRYDGLIPQAALHSSYKKSCQGPILAMKMLDAKDRNVLL